MRFDSVLCVLFWMTLSQGAMSLVLSLPGGIPAPSAATAPWLVVVGLTGLSAHYALTSALGHAPASIVAPMEFIRLPIIALIGMWLYAEPLRLGGLRRRGADHRRQPDQPARRDAAAPAGREPLCAAPAPVLGGRRKPSDLEERGHGHRARSPPARTRRRTST